MICSDALQATNSDGVFFNPAAPAGGLAGTVTNATKNSGEYVGLAILHIRRGKIALRDHADIRRNVGMSGAAPLAIDYLMEVFRVRSICWLHSDVHTGIIFTRQSLRSLVWR